MKQKIALIAVGIALLGIGALAPMAVHSIREADPPAHQIPAQQQGWVKASPDVVSMESDYLDLAKKKADEGDQINKLPLTKQYLNDSRTLEGLGQDLLRSAPPGFTVNPSTAYGYFVPAPSVPAAPPQAQAKPKDK